MLPLAQTAYAAAANLLPTATKHVTLHCRPTLQRLAKSYVAADK